MEPTSSASAPQRVEPRKSGRLRSGCVAGLLLLAAACGLLWIQIRLPARLAGATHERIHRDATVRAVIAVAEEYWSVTGSQCPAGVESFQVFTPGRVASGSVLIRRGAAKGHDDQEELRFGDKAELLRIFDERADLRSCRRLDFTFRISGVPPKTSFAVEFGEDGRVIRVAPPYTWD